MMENKEESAMRIMEALSGVDEELLERSGIRTFLWRHAKAWAAVLCLAIAGRMAWDGYQLKMADMQKNNSGLSGMAAEGGQAPGSVPESESAGNTADIPESPEDVDENGARGTVNSECNDITSASGTEDGLASGVQPFGISEAEARGLEGLGDYIPMVIPEGYGFECAYSSAGTQESGETADWLNIIWTNGADRIELYIEKIEDDCDVVNVDKRELYDVRLYGQPYEETVPDKYKAVSCDPVFALEDFGLEIVESRMVPLDEGNQDTGVCKGNFGVLYPDNVLIRFDGTGTAEEIWEMFRSINN